ncbi:hypothetical protein [Mesorhizobium sp.]|uniref:hypothetical protein n=1 Tax=Mesorhizobium sp. TaxID=1871066 RepID=UPI0025E67D63|nr:hypothetical protein [Mesorhizobium sp.]
MDLYTSTMPELRLTVTLDAKTHDVAIRQPWLLQRCGAGAFAKNAVTWCNRWDNCYWV